MISIDERVWQSIEFGWTYPTYIIVNDVRTVKPKSKLTKEENDTSSYNGKGINALSNALSQTELSLVSACGTVK